MLSGEQAEGEIFEAEEEEKHLGLVKTLVSDSPKIGLPEGWIPRPSVESFSGVASGDSRRERGDSIAQR
jgi:hypothetical protein